MLDRMERDGVFGSGSAGPFKRLSVEHRIMGEVRQKGKQQGKESTAKGVVTLTRKGSADFTLGWTETARVYPGSPEVL